MPSNIFIYYENIILRPDYKKNPHTNNKNNDITYFREHDYLTTTIWTVKKSRGDPSDIKTFNELLTFRS